MKFEDMINTIQLGDCCEVMKNIPDESIDLIITSPPYDDLRNYNKTLNWSFEIFQGIANEIYRVIKKGGVVVWVVGDSTKNGSETGTSFKQVLYFKKIGFNLHDTMIYEKNTSTFPAKKTGCRYTQIFEYMFVLSKGKPGTVNLICDKKNKWGGVTTWGNSWNRNKNDELVKSDHKVSIPLYSPRNNIWRYKIGKSKSSGKGGIKGHPAVFPIELAKDHIQTWSNKNDLVLDCFCGSGTTCLASKEMERKYIGIEINKEYFKIANDRVQEKEKQNTIFDYLGDDNNE